MGIETSCKRERKEWHFNNGGKVYLFVVIYSEQDVSYWWCTFRSGRRHKRCYQGPCGKQFWRSSLDQQPPSCLYDSTSARLPWTNCLFLQPTHDPVCCICASDKVLILVSMAFRLENKGFNCRCNATFFTWSGHCFCSLLPLRRKLLCCPSKWVSVTIESEPTKNSADLDPIFPDLRDFLETEFSSEYFTEILLS